MGFSPPVKSDFSGLKTKLFYPPKTGVFFKKFFTFSDFTQNLASCFPQVFLKLWKTSGTFPVSFPKNAVKTTKCKNYTLKLNFCL